jgi:glycosyltransferase involved in cell wall biosynthesis
MMTRALAQWPIRFASPGAVDPEPEVTFILPIRGKDRVQQLLATIDSILGQEGARVECLVVEQSNSVEVRDALPRSVRYFHLPHPEGDPAWRKCWAYNCGARKARAPLLVCHDADILVPTGYSRALLELARRGFEAMYLQRFLFYLGQEDSMAVTDRRVLGGACPVDVWQNWKGGTVAILASAYWRIGGFDERFVNWGGEDNEFQSRCATLNAFSFGSVPFVHLWHPAQPAKHGPERERNLAYLSEVMEVPVQDRIARLRRMVEDGQR